MLRPRVRLYGRSLVVLGFSQGLEPQFSLRHTPVHVARLPRHYYSALHLNWVKLVTRSSYRVRLDCGGVSFVILILWVAMEVGKKVVVLYNGGKGGVTHFAEALGSDATALQRVVSRLYPWKDSSGEGKGSSEIVHFKDHAGETQVSLIVIREEVPASACGRVVNELFHYLLSNAPIQSPDFRIVLPAILRMPGSTVEVDTGSKNVNIFTAFVNGTPENTGTLDHLPKLPPAFTLRDGILAYMIHYAHATGLPTQLLVGPSPQGVAAPNNESIEALHILGDVVGKLTGLPFSKQNLAKVGNLAPMLDSVEDDWRRLYI